MAALGRRSAQPPPLWPHRPCPRAQEVGGAEGGGGGREGAMEGEARGGEAAGRGMASGVREAKVPNKGHVIASGMTTDLAKRVCWMVF